MVEKVLENYTLYVLDDEYARGREIYTGWYEFRDKEKQLECARILNSMNFNFVFDPSW